MPVRERRVTVDAPTQSTTRRPAGAIEGVDTPAPVRPRQPVETAVVPVTVVPGSKIREAFARCGIPDTAVETRMDSIRWAESYVPPVILPEL